MPDLIVDRRKESARDYLGLIVVDAACCVKFRFWEGSQSIHLKSIVLDDDGALQPEFKVRVARMIEQSISGERGDRRIILLGERHAVRFSPLHGTDEQVFGLIVEAERESNSLARATGRFGLTKRQAQVLALVLEGSSAAEIAQVLMISEYTAQGYLKSLLSKTASRNRAAMVAKVLDWTREAAPKAEAAAAGAIEA